MAASVGEKLQACVVLIGTMMKLLVYMYSGCLGFMCKFLLQTMFGSKEPNYYVVSALLWMKQEY